MKKLIAVMLVSLLALFAAAALAEAPLDGGWSVAESAAVTDEYRAVFDKALEQLVGVDYEPIAYLGSQVVAGTNHCFLCRSTVVVPGAEPSLSLVYIYEDLEGNAEITNIAGLDIAALSAPIEQ